MSDSKEDVDDHQDFKLCIAIDFGTDGVGISKIAYYTDYIINTSSINNVLFFLVLSTLQTQIN